MPVAIKRHSLAMSLIGNPLALFIGSFSHFFSFMEIIFGHCENRVSYVSQKEYDNGRWFTMNKFDIEFWNGGLNALILAAEKLKQLAEEDEANSEGILIGRRQILDIKAKIEYIHSKDFNKALDD